MISYLSTAMVLIGLVIHVAALAPARRLIGIIPAGSLRNKWFSMTGLIIIFIVGYFGFVVVLWGRLAEWRDLLIPGIFDFGAMFVWLTTSLSLQTAVDLRRMDLLETENITDPLTKVYNRRYLDRRLEEEVARAERYALKLSVLMLDIDHFKRINDTYGHQGGDVTLSTLGNLLKASLRDVDNQKLLMLC